MKPHKWAKEIKAWADGAEIEFRDPLQGWVECKNPSWTEAAIYRIKPQPKEPQYLHAYSVEGQIKLSEKSLKDFDGYVPQNVFYLGKIKLETDND